MHLFLHQGRWKLNWAGTEGNGHLSLLGQEHKLGDVSSGEEARVKTMNDLSILPFKQAKLVPGSHCFVSEALHVIYAINPVLFSVGAALCSEQW